MVNPISAFRRLLDIATRWPRLVWLVGFALVGEAGRVAWTMKAGLPVTLFGHTGADRFDPFGDGPFLVAYVGWVGFCGLVVMALSVVGAGRARSAAKRAKAGMAEGRGRGAGRAPAPRPAPVTAPPAMPFAPPPQGAPEPAHAAPVPVVPVEARRPVVERMRRHEEMRRR